MARPVVRAVFALLVVATIAAFFVTQQLKSEFPLVIRFSAKPKQFSPNGDRYRDSAQVGFDLSEPAKVSFLILDSEGAAAVETTNQGAKSDRKHGDRDGAVATHICRNVKPGP